MFTKAILKSNMKFLIPKNYAVANLRLQTLGSKLTTRLKLIIKPQQSSGSVLKNEELAKRNGFMQIATNDSTRNILSKKSQNYEITLIIKPAENFNIPDSEIHQTLINEISSIKMSPNANEHNKKSDNKKVEFSIILKNKKNTMRIMVVDCEIANSDFFVKRAVALPEKFENDILNNTFDKYAGPIKIEKKKAELFKKYIEHITGINKDFIKIIYDFSINKREELNSKYMSDLLSKVTSLKDPKNSQEVSENPKLQKVYLD